MRDCVEWSSTGDEECTKKGVLQREKNKCKNNNTEDIDSERRKEREHFFSGMILIFVI